MSDTNQTPIDPLDVPQQTQRQDSTAEQLRDLTRWANRLGMYDAYDWLSAQRPRVSGAHDMSDITPTRRTFRITTAWVRQDDENPWLLAAYDEYTEDAWGGTPEFFDAPVSRSEKQGDEVRIVDLLIDYDAIEERFSAVTVEADVSSGSSALEGDR